ncbi:hypothetical protein RJ55_02797 [Drechmeria coniospora]|nr:hypothetical protein RJ55_02797 [Drechmeria coniospora]
MASVVCLGADTPPTHDEARTGQGRAAQGRAAQQSTGQHSTGQHSTGQHGAAQSRGVARAGGGDCASGAVDSATSLAAAQPQRRTNGPPWTWAPVGHACRYAQLATGYSFGCATSNVSWHRRRGTDGRGATGGQGRARREHGEGRGGGGMVDAGPHACVLAADMALAEWHGKRQPDARNCTVHGSRLYASTDGPTDGPTDRLAWRVGDACDVGKGGGARRAGGETSWTRVLARRGWDLSTACNIAPPGRTARTCTSAALVRQGNAAKQSLVRWTSPSTSAGQRHEGPQTLPSRPLPHGRTSFRQVGADRLSKVAERLCVSYRPEEASVSGWFKGLDPREVMVRWLVVGDGALSRDAALVGG